MRSGIAGRLIPSFDVVLVNSGDSVLLFDSPLFLVPDKEAEKGSGGTCTVIGLETATDR